ncbi:GDP-fucose protein O-fucosyltransferase 2 [Lepeophtheirus salmonis]|uniref:GDP-fucose protein O-fucosyltransferase 2 n=1 Tax=Lepeophtheirus salmonis TaxID=72036 RepID=UPI001AE11BE3|nr:GDP-fucose protein O-fucosyltransferase 2-like [Lepeophtheirus salmonis]
MQLVLRIILVSLIFLNFVSSEVGRRYILYDVNPGEGFNLRRDVFSRVAVFVKKLNLNTNISFTLVLPPWDRLYHWQSKDISDQRRISWSIFFNLEGISRYVPVIEFTDFLDINGLIIDSTYYLQSYKEGWEDGNFEEKWDYRECIDRPPYKKQEKNRYRGYFWGYSDVETRNFSCISVQGTTQVIKDLVNQGGKSVMIDRAENLLHDWFGDEEYWSIRRATRFSSSLVNIGEEFRNTFLDSNDEKDDTVVHELWEHFQPERKITRGGPYLSAHLRRKDFLTSRNDKLPSLKGAAEQLRKKLLELNLKKVFIASDAPDEEFRVLESNLQEFEVYRYSPPTKVKRVIKDGGVAIVDQIICAHAQYFIGSYESTFSFRIQEEREILGFMVANTFDILCPDGQDKCSKGSVWKIVYPKTKQSNNNHMEL